MMSRDDSDASAFIARLKELPFFRDQQKRYDFEAVMMVTTYGTVDFATARDYALSDQMCGRVRPQANMFDDIVRWFFEFEEDAVLFTLKFGASLPRRLT